MTIERTPTLFEESHTEGEDQAFVLGQAVRRAAEGLGMSVWALATTLGLDESCAADIASGARGIDPASPEGKSSLMLVKVFEALEAIVGGETARRTWMSTSHAALRGMPSLLVLTPQGLDRVLRYLEERCDLGGQDQAGG